MNESGTIISLSVNKTNLSGHGRHVRSFLSPLMETTVSVVGSKDKVEGAESVSGSSIAVFLRHARVETVRSSTRDPVF